MKHNTNGLPWKKWSTLTERIWLIQTLETGGLNEPKKVFHGTNYRDSATS
jgi:hypothetical protein